MHERDANFNVNIVCIYVHHAHIPTPGENENGLNTRYREIHVFKFSNFIYKTFQVSSSNFRPNNFYY